jgi:gliding motility-associated protein GldL
MAKNSGPNFFWDKLVPTIYSAGAAVVILGALAKIQHWDFGGPLLTAGLGTEVLIFLLYALQTLTQSSDKDPDWTRVYPELADDLQRTSNHPRFYTKQQYHCQAG